MDQRAHILVHGHVQGVFFRYSSQQQAKRLGLVGWVQNNPDGAVEILAQGASKNLKSFIDWCHTGPLLARVSKVDVSFRKTSKDFESFERKN